MKSVKLERLMRLLDLYGAQFDRALAKDDGDEMERQRVRSRATVAFIADMLRK